jgi:hypothetical protein
LISRFTVAPVRRASSSTSAIVAMRPRGATARARRPPPGLPSTSGRQARNASSVRAATSPVQSVVRSSVASWIATGTPSAVSLASTSSTNPSRAAARYASRLSSA